MTNGSVQILGAVLGGRTVVVCKLFSSHLANTSADLVAS